MQNGTVKMIFTVPFIDYFPFTLAGKSASAFVVPKFTI